jgi:DNA-directed RNA polymerase I, II, and III subunit RPABC1
MDLDDPSNSLLEEERLRKLWRVRRTAEKMLTKRGFICPLIAEYNKHFMNITFEEFKALNLDRKGLQFLAQREGEDEKILVFFAEEEKVGVKDVRSYISNLDTAGARRAILITEVAVSAHGRNAIAELAPKYIFEEFTMAQLLIDITEHELVPLHVVLTAEEKRLLLKEYNLTESQLPRMLLSDPIARYYGLSRGDVVKITRPSETSGRYVTYRIVM